MFPVAGRMCEKESESEILAMEYLQVVLKRLRTMRRIIYREREI